MRWHSTEFDFYPDAAFSPRAGGGMTLEGGKGGNSAPAPDPALVAAQIKSMGIQDDMIGEIMKLSKDMAPLQKEQMQFGIDSARTAYDQSQQDRNWTLGKRDQLDAAQKPLLDMASSFNEGDRRADMYGESSADISQAFSTVRGTAARDMARMGVNPSDGKIAATSNQMAMGEALAKASAGRAASKMARDEGIQLKSTAANMLAGYPAMGMQATGAGAGYAASGLGLANQGAAGMNSGFGAAGGMAGQMGSNATNMWGQQANYHSNMQEQDQTGSMLGGIGGLAAGAAKIAPLFMSDRRLKQDIVQVGTHEPTGLPLYHFAYRLKPDQRYEGVMADEVRAVMPGAVHTGPDGFDRVDYAQLGIDMKEVA